MINSQLVKAGMAPVPASFRTVMTLYKQAQRTAETAEQAIEEEAQHPHNFTRARRLTPRGLSVLHDMFRADFSDSQISEFMGMDVSSVNRRRQEWQS